MPSPNKTRKLTTLAMLAASALVLSWLDSLIPVSGCCPGQSWGLRTSACSWDCICWGPGLAGLCAC